MSRRVNLTPFTTGEVSQGLLALPLPVQLEILHAWLTGAPEELRTLARRWSPLLPGLAAGMVERIVSEAMRRHGLALLLALPLPLLGGCAPVELDTGEAGEDACSLACLDLCEGVDLGAPGPVESARYEEQGGQGWCRCQLEEEAVWLAVQVEGVCP